MTVPAQRSRQWPNAPGSVLRLLLTVVMLLPITVLFMQLQRSVDDRQRAATLEQHGVEYVRSLTVVTGALADAQSAAVIGRPVPRDALARAVEDAAAVDTRLGAELQTHERWAGVRAKIEALPDRGPTDAEGVYSVYTETSDLLGQLLNKVRETSGLVSDQQTDSFYLQDGATQELPAALVATGQLADLAVLGAARPSTERLRTVADLTGGHLNLDSPAGDLIADLQAAVDSTNSPSLGANLLKQLDTYQRAVQGLTSLVHTTSANDLTQIAAARATLHTATVELSTSILNELAALINGRIDGLARTQQIAIGGYVLALVLLLAMATLTVRGTRRRQPIPPTPAAPSGPPPAAASKEPGRWDELAEWSAAGSPSPPAALSAGTSRPVAPVGVSSDNPPHWGRSDAAR
jgi:hypothetical protein